MARTRPLVAMAALVLQRRAPLATAAVARCADAPDTLAGLVQGPPGGATRRHPRHELARIDHLEHLVIHVFTEADSEDLVREVLAPAAGGDASPAALAEVFGVEGEYGRH
jgi:hypothetical protein